MFSRMSEGQEETSSARLCQESWGLGSTCRLALASPRSMGTSCQAWLTRWWSLWQDKVYQFCCKDCCEDFKRLHGVVSQCEHCKQEKLLHEKIRFSGVEKNFCSEGTWGRHRRVRAPRPARAGGREESMERKRGNCLSQALGREPCHAVKGGLSVGMACCPARP